MSSGDVSSYRDLQVWQAAMALAKHAYVLTRDFPTSETYGMTAQIRRASVSIAANIAEGYGRETTRSFISFLRSSQGSLKELETHLLLAASVELISEGAAQALLGECDELGRMLRAMIRSLQRKLEADE